MKRYVIIFLCFITNYLNAQIKSTGTYYVVNYSVTNNELLATTNSMIQDQSGIMYFGNNKGITTFDGHNWQQIKLPNNSGVFSITTDKEGIIYAGGMDELGFLKPDSIGNIVYTTLIPKLEKKYRNIGNITGIFTFPDGVLFVSSSILIFYNKKDCYPIGSFSEYSQAFKYNDKVIINQRNAFKIFHNGKLEDFISAEKLDCRNTNAFIEWENNKPLAICNEKGCYKIENQQQIEIKNTAFSSFAIKNKIISCIKLRNGYYVLGSMLDGALIIDKHGLPVQHLNKNSGLENNRITSLYEDINGNLWLGHDMGISYVEISSPFTYLVPKGEGSGFSAKVYKNKLYLGTAQELLTLPWPNVNSTLSNNVKTEQVGSISGQVWNLDVIDNILYACSNNGTYVVNANSAKRIDPRTGSWIMKTYANNRGLFLQGTYTSFSLFKEMNGALQFQNEIKNFYKSTRIFEIDNQDKIWVTHGYEGVYQLQLNPTLDQISAIKFYGKGKGFPSNLGINVFRIQNKILFSSESGGIYEYNADRDSFILFTEFEPFLGKYPKLSKLYEDYEGNIWFVELNRTGVLVNNGQGHYHMIEKPFSGLSRAQIRGFELIYPIDNRNVIMGTTYGFLHYDPLIQKDYDIPYYAKIRKTEITGLKDSTVFGGFRTDFMDKHPLIFPHKYNSLRFSYVAPFYESIENTEYSSYLEGFDKGWSEWTIKTEREYTNLPEGDYIFHVKAKNLYNNESIEDTYNFHVNPPFSRTWLAYFLYLISFGLLVSFLVNVYSKKKVEKYRRDALIKEGEIILLKNQQLNSEIEFKNKDLGSMTMQIIKRNEMLLNIKNKLDENYSKFKPDVINAVDMIIKSIDNEVNTEKDWEFFQVNFDSVYKGFLKRLKELFPELKTSELQLCAYIRMGLSNKEIATLMNSTYRGIEGYRYRLRKNLNLDHDENIKDFLFNLLD